MADCETPQQSRSHPPSRAALLILLALMAAGAMLARRADGSVVLPPWLAITLQTPAILAWLHGRCAWFGLIRRRKASPVDRWLTLCVMGGGLDVAIRARQADVFFVAIVTFICTALVIEALVRLYRQADCRITGCVADAARRHPPAQAGGSWLRLLAGPWLVMILAAAILLSLPLATRSSVPDYRHNFWQHVLCSLHAAVGSACLSGTTVYSFGEDYSFFGQAILLAVTHLSGLGIAAVGLAILQPFLPRVVRLRTVLLALLGFQLLAVAVLWLSWETADTPTNGGRLWCGLVHTAGALWNAGWTLRPAGLSAHLSNGPVFVTISSLAIIGSLSVPILLGLIGPGNQPATANRLKEPAVWCPPWQRLAPWEGAVAFGLLLLGAVLLFYFETPRAIPETLVPTRPVDLGAGQIALRDDMLPTRRWTTAVFVSATVRSAGIQSIPLQEGALSWPSYVLLVLWMFVGGSAGGVAGGLRTTTLALTAACILYSRRAWSLGPGAMAARRDLLRGIACFVLFWITVNAASVLALAVTTTASAYELIFEGVAACNSVGLSTGLSQHLTWTGRLAIIVILIVGRVAPIAFWLSLSRSFARRVDTGGGDESDTV